MIKTVRNLWFNNVPVHYTVDGHKITRRKVQIYGGPNPDFNGCVKCQCSEWLSRVWQRNVFSPHGCPTAVKCAALCAKQGNELWTHYHQDFRFALSCNPLLDAPKCLCYFPKRLKPRLWQRFWQNVCDPWMLTLKRQLAQACQVDVVLSLDGVKWSDYDFMFIQNARGLPAFEKPPIPVVMYGHDIWKGDLQTPLTKLRPEILLTPVPGLWKHRFDIPLETEIRFYLPPAPSFFTRTNLGPKKLAVLIAGALYPLRRVLHDQISPWAKAFKIDWHYEPGYYRNSWTGPVKLDRNGAKIRYLNAYSEYLGSAIYAVFGPKYPSGLVTKHFELLGSGAIPIMPHHPLLDELGIEPMKHYIPLIRVWKNPAYLKHLLKQRHAYKHIAMNAVSWHRESVDKMLFGGFEDMVQHITNHQYPRRLIGA